MNIEPDGQTAGAEPVDVSFEQVEQVEEQQSEATTDDSDGDEDAANPDAPKKVAKGVQKRLDELTRLRHDAERNAEYWREMAMRQNPQPEQPLPVPQSAPVEDQFATYDDFLVAKAKHEFRQEQAQADQMAAEQRRIATYSQREAQARERLPNYDAVALSPIVPISPDMAEVIQESEKGPEIAYYLGSNLDEAKRIASLSPRLQAAELGKIEVRISTPAKSSTPPPAPPKTVQGAVSGGVKDPAKMSMAEYVEWRKAGNS